jgi:hypothetical protein
MLLWCDRHCCMCKKTCATDIEIAHIDRRGGNDIENGIPLCYDCHAKIGHYNREHPRGNKYKPDELKARREQIYEEYTRNLVPPIHFYLDQRKVDNTLHDLPFVGFRLQHVADSLPVRVRIEARIIVGGVDLGLVNDPSGYYSGQTKWNINPRILFWGGFSIEDRHAKTALNGTQELKIEIRVTVIDQFDREHRLLPQCFRYVKDGNFWNLEPRSFAEWA